MASERETVYSRSALAEKLGVSLKQLTQTMIDAGWIRQGDNHVWKLTTKGEFEGGHYRHSQKYGEYIIWPASILTHKVFEQFSHKYISATLIGKPFELSAQTVNAVLTELGWITHHLKGWKLTAAGSALGAEQKEDAKSGVPYVSWPQDLTTNVQLNQILNQMLGQPSGQGAKSLYALDGHQLASIEEVRVDNWLYIHKILHAYRRPIYSNTDFSSDFFLPENRVYIELWPSLGDAKALALKLEKRALYQQRELKFIELQPEDFDWLDEVLSRELFKLDVDI